MRLYMMPNLFLLFKQKYTIHPKWYYGFGIFYWSFVCFSLGSFDHKLSILLIHSLYLKIKKNNFRFKHTLATQSIYGRYRQSQFMYGVNEISITKYHDQNHQ